MGDFLVILVASSLVILSIRHILKNRKKGCSLGCEGCSRNCSMRKN